MDAVTRESDAGALAPTTSSPLDRAISSYLPGMAEEVLPVPITDDAIDALPRHTAARLLELHPDRYALATALFFGCPLMSFRDVCRIARVGTHTLQMIIEREEQGRTADSWRKTASARLRAMADAAMGAAQDLMCDTGAVREAGIKGLATLIRESTHAHELLAGRIPGQGAGKAGTVGDADSSLASLQQVRVQSIEGAENGGVAREVEAADQAGADGAADGQEVVQ